jgi:hypothetical protein
MREVRHDSPRSLRPLAVSTTTRRTAVKGSYGGLVGRGYDSRLKPVRLAAYYVGLAVRRLGI